MEVIRLQAGCKGEALGFGVWRLALGVVLVLVLVLVLASREAEHQHSLGRSPRIRRELRASAESATQCDGVLNRSGAESATVPALLSRLQR